MKLTRKQLIQIIAPIIVVLVICALFVIYHMIQTYQPVEEEQVEAGLVACEDLGCPPGTKFVGSAKSNVYHECSSPYAVAILPENRICFASAAEAEARGYRPAKGE